MKPFNGPHNLPQLLHLPETLTVVLVAGAAPVGFRLLPLLERHRTPA